VGNAFIRGLGNLLGYNQLDPASRAEFDAQAYRLSAKRAVGVCWAVLLADLPLFVLVDYATWQAGDWATQPAHERIFWWRAGLSVAIVALLLARWLIRDAALRDRAFAWASAVTFPAIGVWFAVVCQTLITDASIYALFLIGASVLFPLPSLNKLLIFPACLLAMLLGVHAVQPDPVPALHVMINAIMVTVGAFVTETVAMRTYIGEQVKSLLLEQETRRADRLLRNVLPPKIAERFMTDDSALVEYHPQVSILFADFVGFGRLTQSLPPEQMIGLLDALFHEFDEAADRFGAEKIKTIGDSYMAASGVPVAQPDHARRIAELALRIQSIAGRFKSDRDLPVQFRIGLHTGPAIAGIIGRKKFCYDLWGDTVNLAALLQFSGTPGCIHISAAMREALGDEYRYSTPDPVQLKGRETTQTYCLLGRSTEGEALKDRPFLDALPEMT
jgi:class 3 adenylate cyclase